MTITRKIGRRRAVRRAGTVALLLSLLAHIILVLIFVPGWLERLKEQRVEPPPPAELKVEAVYEEEPEPPEPEPIQEPTVAEVPEVKIPATNEDAVPEKSMMVASVEPTPQEPPKEPVEPPAVAQAEEQEPEPPPLEEQSPIILKKKPQPSARSLLMPSAAAYEQMFADADVEAHEHAREHSKGKRLFKDYERNTAGIKATLSSFGHDVKPGNHTGVSSNSNAFGSYVGMIHQKIHNRWANGYLIDLDLSEPRGSAMNDPKLNTLLEFVIRAADGELEAVNIVRSSGQLRFDAQAVAVAHSTGPHPNPPPELVSPNGKVYVHWNFWRDQRQCGMFGANVFIVSEHGGSPG